MGKEKELVDKLKDKEVYVSISGGADSTAMALILWELGVDFEYIFCDTGTEFPETYETIRRLVNFTGRKLNYLKSKQGDLFEVIKKRKLMPRFNCRFCTQELKIFPVRDFLLNHHDNYIVATGIRTDEKKRVKPDKEFKKVYPLVELGLKKADTFKKCQEYDLLNPIYQYFTRTSCFACPFKTKEEWLTLLKYYPELYRRAEELEEWHSRLYPSKYGWNRDFTLKELRENFEKRKKLFELGVEEINSINRRYER